MSPARVASSPTVERTWLACPSANAVSTDLVVPFVASWVGGRSNTIDASVVVQRGAPSGRSGGIWALPYTAVQRTSAAAPATL